MSRTTSALVRHWGTTSHGDGRGRPGRATERRGSLCRCPVRLGTTRKSPFDSVQPDSVRPDSTRLSSTMSQSAPADSIDNARSEALSRDRALGARENFWGDDLSASTEDEDEDPDRDYGRHHRFKPAQDKDAILAHRLLRESATMLCGETLRSAPYNGGRLAELVAWCFDDECIDGREEAMHHSVEQVELTDPQAHIPRAASAEFGTCDSGQYRHRARVNEETGYLSGHGGSTHVVIADRPTDEFMAVVDVAIRLFDPIPREARNVRNRAKSMKCDPSGKHDTEIMRDVVGWLRQEEGSA